MGVLVLLLIGLMAVVMGDVCARWMHEGQRFAGAALFSSLFDRAAKAWGLLVLALREGAFFKRGLLALALQQPGRDRQGEQRATQEGEADAGQADARTSAVGSHFWPGAGRGRKITSEYLTI